MKLRIARLLLIALGFLLIAGCGNRNRPTAYIVATRVTCFATQTGSSQLQFPMMAKRITSDELIREIDEAEYYYRKLSALYDFKTFALLGTKSLDTLLKGKTPLQPSFALLTPEEFGSKVSITLLAVDERKGEFQWSMKDKQNQEKNYSFTVENGKSSSIGIIVDSQNNTGILTIVSFWVMPVNKRTNPDAVKEFLAKKNQRKDGGDSTHNQFSETDQAVVDSLYGIGKVSLPVQTISDTLNDNSVQFQNLDQPPFPVGGMGAIVKRVHYPEFASKKQIQGTVFLSLLIDSTGKIARKKILRGVHPELDKAALAAVDSMQFIPPRMQNRPVNAWVTLPIAFRLR